ncbi:Disease resistance protein [Melia azedarach]|uniref:Disease resistance protein n=1 Tax=Melia azedarach TaxID=155640 RepID=A0ACC1WQA9_MELAZ|nr:Disease resistance protein [Melia azedarach]
MNIEKNFRVETVSPEEAENLFWRIVGEYHSAKSSTDFRTGAEIVGKCAGLPLAIATIANALKNKSIDAWELALDELRTANPRSIPEVDKRVVSVLELSFNLLPSDEAKKLFLLCSLINFGHGISLDYLLRYSMGWGLFQNVYSLETGRKRLHVLIENLKASSLLLEGHTHNWVKMHEFIHAVAKSIAATSKLMFTIQDVPNLNKILEEKISENRTAISMPYRDISELPERLGCPKLELLFLFMNSSLQIPNNFFEGMKQLKVIDCDCINLQLLPSSFSNLTNLQTLCLDGCLLGDVSNIGELKNLEILSFSHSSILLDLGRCFKLKVIAPNVISSFSQLEELYLDNTPVQWENELDNQDGSNANLDELNQLSQLTTLRMSFLDAQIIPSNLCFEQLKRYRISIGDVWSWSHRNEASRMLKLKINSSSYLGYKPIKILLETTEELFLDELNGVQNFLHELDEEGFPNLKHLHVRNGFELLYIVNSQGRIHYNAFPMLEVLRLTNLINLENICYDPLKETSFNKLRTVEVNKCDGLKHRFSISMAKSLSKLQEIEVTDCENLKVIFAEEDDEGCVHDDSTIEFAQLRSLILQRLPQFTNFSFNTKTLLATNTPSTEITTADDHEDYKSLFGKRVEFPSLENLKLSLIGIQKIWPEQLLSIASYCHTVKSLTLEDCNGLKFLLSSSMVKSFAQLQRLVLCNCASMEQVLHSKGLEAEESISFPNLFYLELKDLPKLTRFGNGNIIEFPYLNVLIIENCPNFRTFFANNTCTDMAASNELEEMNSMENLQTDKPLFGDKVGFPSLEVLIVLQMHNLRKIWEHQLSLESFCKIKILRVEDCNKLLNIFPSNMLGRLQILEYLDVINCDSLEEVFEFQALGGQMKPAIAAAQLRELHLCHLPNLKHVWDMDSQAILAFDNLLKIRVHGCPGLKSIFPASIANDLHKLEELDIVTCLLEEVIGKDIKVEEFVIPRFRFPRLTSLTLSGLAVLKTFYPKTHISEWPALKKMEVSGCATGCGTVKILVSELQSPLDHLQPLFLVDKVAFPSLKELKLSHLPELLHLLGENTHSSRVFQNLATLEISACEKLKTLVPSSVSLWNLKTLDISRCDELVSLVTLPTAKSLVNLTRIDIVDCKMIEEIITHVKDGGNNDNQVVLKQLNYLRLRQLSSLTSFCCLGNYAIQLPSLEKVIVGHCPKMAMMEKVYLKEADDQDNLDNSGQHLFKEMVGFQGIKYLKISEFPQLKKIWHDQLLPGSFFCNLTSLVLDNCGDMSSAISANLVQSLNKLEMLEVRIVIH